MEVGFIIGVDEVGLVGVIVGTVVIGVVMSFWVVEIEVVTCSCLSSWLGSKILTFRPVLEMTTKGNLYLFCSVISVTFEHGNSGTKSELFPFSKTTSYPIKLFQTRKLSFCYMGTKNSSTIYP